jgi:asparagine synthase (glutamine-hydrolysing)
VLAAAVRSARAQGVEPPTAVTLRYPGLAEADESKWQKLVLDHLGVDRQIVVDVVDELDLVGPVATQLLERHGVLFPPNAHSLAALLPPARGGSLLLGLGGDELLGDYRWTPLNDALARRRRPVARDAGRLAVARLPSPLRARVLARRSWQLDRPWLRPAARRELTRLERRAADEPLRFDRALAKAARLRSLAIARVSLELLAADTGTAVEFPLLDNLFVAALARAAGPRGVGERAAVMRAVAHGVLPDALLERRDKAFFTATFFGPATAEFARRWSGEGLDDSLVDPEVLRALWLGENPDFRSAMLLQTAWLHDRRASRAS